MATLSDKKLWFILNLCVTFLSIEALLISEKVDIDEDDLFILDKIAIVQKRLESYRNSIDDVEKKVYEKMYTAETGVKNIPGMFHYRNIFEGALKTENNTKGSVATYCAPLFEYAKLQMDSALRLQLPRFIMKILRKNRKDLFLNHPKVLHEMEQRWQNYTEKDVLDCYGLPPGYQDELCTAYSNDRVKLSIIGRTDFYDDPRDLLYRAADVLVHFTFPDQISALFDRVIQPLKSCLDGTLKPDSIEPVILNL